jgi:tRNA threonylcarbamoyladenosine biosynthesis protein TsaB
VSALVGLDTATPSTSVGVLVPGGPEVELRDDPEPGARPRHAERLQPLLEEALAQAGLTWEDVARICVGTGPGGFTGLRLGVSTARALAQGLGLPVVGVSSLEALARGVEQVASRELGTPGDADPHGPVLAVLDARRGEVFAAGWRDGAEVVIAPAALAPAALAERVRTLPGRPLAVGDGAVAFRPDMHAAGAVVPEDASPLHRVRAEWICRLGALAGGVDPETVLPDYLRPPDATPRAGRPRP